MRKCSRRSLYLVACVAAATASFASLAHAHISLEMGGSHMSRSGDGNDEQKDAPCGLAGSTRGTNVYTFEPGQVITLKVVETIAHPGYFRVAFDNEGDDGFEDPQAIKPENRECMDGETRCGMDDFCNNETVLLDNIEPHWDAQLTDPAVTRTWQLKLPDVECETCTIQVIQTMTDPPGHGPYDLMDDVYHQCIDIVLKRGAGMVEAGAPTSASNSVPMMDCKPAAAAPTASAGAGGAAAPNMPGGAAGAGASGPIAAPGAGGASGPMTPASAPGSSTAMSAPAGSAGSAAVAMSAPLGGSGAPVPALPPTPAASSGCNVAHGATSTASATATAALWPLAWALLPLARRRRRR
jgi:MYXO-CTERM domain-containing protein